MVKFWEEGRYFVRHLENTSVFQICRLNDVLDLNNIDLEKLEITSYTTCRTINQTDFELLMGKLGEKCLVVEVEDAPTTPSSASSSCQSTPQRSIASEYGREEKNDTDRLENTDERTTTSFDDVSMCYFLVICRHSYTFSLSLSHFETFT